MLNCFTGSHFGRALQSRIPEYVKARAWLLAKVIYNSFKTSPLGLLLALGNMKTTPARKEFVWSSIERQLRIRLAIMVFHLTHLRNCQFARKSI